MSKPTTVRLTTAAKVMYNRSGAPIGIVCREHRTGVQDTESIRCLQCGVTLAWFGYVMSQTTAQEAQAHELTIERHRRAALARWEGRRGECGQGHSVTGGNALKWGDRTRCRPCYLARHATCPQGHPYQGENIKLTKVGKRTCWACITERRAAKESKREQEIAALRAAMADMLESGFLDELDGLTTDGILGVEDLLIA